MSVTQWNKGRTKSGHPQEFPCFVWHVYLPIVFSITGWFINKHVICHQLTTTCQALVLLTGLLSEQLDVLTASWVGITQHKSLRSTQITPCLQYTEKGRNTKLRSDMFEEICCWWKVCKVMGHFKTTMNDDIVSEGTSHNYKTCLCFFSVAQSDAWIWRSDLFEFQQKIGPKETCFFFRPRLDSVFPIKFGLKKMWTEI